MLYGKKEVYRLKLTNVGNGNAENVSILLMPIGGGENVPAATKSACWRGRGEIARCRVDRPAGGNLTIQVDARADAGVHAEAGLKGACSAREPEDRRRRAER